MLPATDLMIQDPARESAPTLVLLHLFGGARREWIETSMLLASHFRVLSIDAPGFGEAKDIEGYSVKEMADCFEETIAERRLENFVLVGHSMTGKVAAVLADRRIPGLRKLVLVTPSPLTPEPMEDASRERMRGQATPTLNDAEEYIRGNSSLPIRNDVFTRAVEDRMRAHPAAWSAWLDRGSHEDWSDRIDRIELPTLVIAAENDRSLGPAVQRKLTMPRLANAQMEIVRDAGHLVPMEAPERLAGLLDAFAAK